MAMVIPIITKAMFITIMTKVMMFIIIMTKASVITKYQDMVTAHDSTITVGRLI